MLGYLFIALAAGVVAWGFEIDSPIPMLSANPGTVLGKGSRSAPIQVEAFFELNCPDSAVSWPVLQQLADSYDGNLVAVTVHQYPLPYHRNALLQTQGLYLVEELDPVNFIPYSDAMFDNIGAFGGSATVDMSENDVIDLLASVASNATGVEEDIFKTFLPAYRGAAVFTWKYAARRGVAGTPWFFVNGVDLTMNPSNFIDFDMWKEYIDGLVGVYRQKGRFGVLRG